MNDPRSLPAILPPGTQVVTRTETRGKDGAVLHPRGAIGVVAAAPLDISHAYRVRLMTGEEASFKRDEIAVLSHFQLETGVPPAKLAEHELKPYVIYRCVIGSRAYGLDDEASDTDYRGIYLPPADLEWSLFGVPEQLDDPDREECYWELKKFLILALKGNPNILECLYSPIVEYADETAQELLDIRHKFLSKLIFATYNGYVLSQFKKLQADLRNHGAVKWKHIMHLLRLLLEGIAALKEGEIRTTVGDHREKLRAIKRGEIPFVELDAWRHELHKAFESAFAVTSLPDRPDYDAANALLVRARRRRAVGR